MLLSLYTFNDARNEKFYFLVAREQRLARIRFYPGTLFRFFSFSRFYY